MAERRIAKNRWGTFIANSDGLAVSTNNFIGTSVASSARAFEAATDTAADRVEATMARRPTGPDVAANSSVAALGDVCLREKAEHGAAAIDKMTDITEYNCIVSDGGHWVE